MKKNNIFYACAAAALVFASCQKENTANNVDNALVPSSEMDVISAVVPQSKTTTLDGVNVLWENGDQIHLYTRTWNESTSKYAAGWCDYTTSLDAPSASASFVKDETNTATVDNTSGRYLAVHYKGATVNTQSRDYYAEITINKAQVAKNGGDFVSSLLYATSTDSQFTFAHAVSYLKFTVDQNTTPFTKLTVSAVNGSEVVVSRIRIDWSTESVTAAPFTGKSQDSNSMSVTTDDSEAFAPGTYYLAINPGTYADGLQFAFSNGVVEDVVTTPANIEMKAGDVANLGTVGSLNLDVEGPVLQLTSVYAEGGENQGVVFWVDPASPSKGKIVSGAVTNVAWGPAKDLSDAMDEYITSHTVVENHEYVKSASDYSEANYPAVYFCDNLPGGDWRLPSHDEQMQMFQTYWGLDALKESTNYNTDANSAAMNKFDSALAQCVADDPATEYVETKLNLGLEASTGSVMYWSGEGRAEALPNSRVYRVVFAPKFTFASYGNPSTVHYVRCVREVELQ